MEKKECPECHQKLKVDKYVNETTVVMSCKHCHKTYKISYDEKTFPKNLYKFNWGAFVLWNIWGLGNGMSELFFLGIAIGYTSKIIFPVTFGYIIASFYYGFRGNILSWQSKEWPSAESFEKSQRIWNIVGIVILALIIIIMCISSI